MGLIIKKIIIHIGNREGSLIQASAFHLFIPSLTSSFIQQILKKCFYSSGPGMAFGLGCAEPKLEIVCDVLSNAWSVDLVLETSVSSGIEHLKHFRLNTFSLRLHLPVSIFFIAPNSNLSQTCQANKQQR